jgi:hypothetical protein
LIAICVFPNALSVEPVETPMLISVALPLGSK